jgi:hypothetical protein
MGSWEGRIRVTSVDVDCREAVFNPSYTQQRVMEVLSVCVGYVFARWSFPALLFVPTEMSPTGFHFAD